MPKNGQIFDIFLKKVSKNSPAWRIQIFFMDPDPDPDPTLAKNMDPDPDPTFVKYMDPDPDPDPT